MEGAFRHHHPEKGTPYSTVPGARYKLIYHRSPRQGRNLAGGNGTRYPVDNDLSDAGAGVPER